MMQNLSQSEHKYIRSLQKRAERERERKCLLEGEHLCSEYVQHIRSYSGSPNAAAQPYYVIIPNDEASPQIVLLANELAECGAILRTTSRQKFHLLCDTATPQSILAVIDIPEHPLREHEPILVLDAIADPGNVGTIIRTADWFGFSNILMGEGSADRFHPKTLRASMGSVFRTAVHSTPTLAQKLQELQPRYTFWGASVQGTATLQQLASNLANSFSKRSPDTGLPHLGLAHIGIVLGNEAHGISPEIMQYLQGTFRIHGGKEDGGGAESLNVAIAAGVILYELSRATREMKKKRKETLLHHKSTPEEANANSGALS